MMTNGFVEANGKLVIISNVKGHDPFVRKYILLQIIADAILNSSLINRIVL